MPTYEYACQSCGNRFEVVHGFQDEPPTKCEACGGTLQKVFHPVGIVFKGSGFYKTDSRKTDRADKPAASTSPSKPSASESTSESTSSESTSKADKGSVSGDSGKSEKSA